LSMFILLSDTCIKNKLTRDYRAKLHPGTFQKYRLFLYLYVGGGVKTSPLFIHLRYTYSYSGTCTSTESAPVMIGKNIRYLTNPAPNQLTLPRGDVGQTLSDGPQKKIRVQMPSDAHKSIIQSSIYYYDQKKRMQHSLE
jgi:hypothetical protein